MKKRISIIVCLVFVFCLLPLQAFASPIAKVEVTGIDAPVVGQSPDMNAVAGDGYYNHVNRIQWKEYNASKIYQRDLTASDTFRAGYYYAVFVTVFTDADIPFTSETTGTINGKSAQIQQLQDDGCSIVLVYNFAEILKEPVTELDLTIPAPVDGEKPDYTKLDGEGYYSDNGLNGTSTRIYKNGIAWYKSATSAMTPDTGETFCADTEYQLKISLLPKEGYFFQVNISVAINGMPATVEVLDDGSINASVTLKAAGPAHTHTPSEWRTTGEYHYKACTSCGEFLEQEDHKGGVATCAEKGKCIVCGYEYIDVHENHTPDTSTWLVRGDMYHYHPCKLCGAHCDIGEHVPGPAGTPDAAVVCKDCGYIITPSKEHTHNLTKVARKDATCTEPGNVEYYTCDGCSDFFSDSEGRNKIDNTIIAPLGHKASEDWKHDENNHWRVCTVCNAVLTETQMGHGMNGGKCTTCNYESNEPNNTPPEITTKSLPDATVGKDYYVRLACSDPDAVFSEFMGSQLSEFGLYLTQHGEIEGTPTKVGNCHINVLVVSEGGDENSFSFDLTVNAAPVGTEPNPTPPESDPTQPPVSAPTDSTDSTQDTTDVTQADNGDNRQEFPWWGYLVIAVGGIAVGIGIAFVFVKLKEKG